MREVIPMAPSRSTTVSRALLVLAVLAVPIAGCQHGTDPGTSAPPPGPASVQQSVPPSVARPGVEATGQPQAEGTGPEAPGSVPKDTISVHSASAPFGLSGDPSDAADCYDVALQSSPPSGVTVRIDDVGVDPTYFTVDAAGCAGSGSPGCSGATFTSSDTGCAFTAKPTGTGHTASVTLSVTGECPAEEHQYCLDLKQGGAQALTQPDAPSPDDESTPPTS